MAECASEDAELEEEVAARARRAPRRSITMREEEKRRTLGVFFLTRLMGVDSSLSVVCRWKTGKCEGSNQERNNTVREVLHRWSIVAVGYVCSACVYDLLDCMVCVVVCVCCLVCFVLVGFPLRFLFGPPTKIRRSIAIALNETTKQTNKRQHERTKGKKERRTTWKGGGRWCGIHRQH